MTQRKRLQIFLQPDWVGFGFAKIDGALRKHYCWALRLGFIEIRRWA